MVRYGFFARGQSGIDMLLAFAVALAFFAALFAYTQSFSGNENESALNGGLRAVLLDVYSAFGSAKAGGATVTYSSPVLRLGQVQGMQQCRVAVVLSPGGSITVSSGGKSVSYSGVDLSGMLVQNSNGQFVQSFDCGERVNILG